MIISNSIINQDKTTKSRGGTTAILNSGSLNIKDNSKINIDQEGKKVETKKKCC